MRTKCRIVDNRVMLLGLDKLYRDAIQRHEREELLDCARRVAMALQVSPADVPVEGYYADDAQLTEYFLLVRALHAVPGKRTAEVEPLPEFQRLLDILSAPLYGHPEYHAKLLPVGRDPLSQALEDTYPRWTIAGLTEAAFARAEEWEDFSLVGLAARMRDPVVLTATRESVVLYARAFEGAALEPPPVAWEVDRTLEGLAGKFTDTFNTLFDEELPRPVAANAEVYWYAADSNRIYGRCVRLGWDDTEPPVRHYHWAIYDEADGSLAVHEFWKPEIWTTSRYLTALLASRPRQWAGLAARRRKDRRPEI